MARLAIELQPEIDKIEVGQGIILTCGNGGSHCHALHLAEELTGRYQKSRQPIPAIPLGNPPEITCISNDFSFDQLYSRLVRCFAPYASSLVVFSTSGNSSNLVRALEAAKGLGMSTIGFLGGNGGICADLCDHKLIVNSEESNLVQEVHQILLHEFVEKIEKRLTKVD